MGRVVHLRKEPYDVLIDRTTKWGNPFIIGKDGTRSEVISKFKEWAESDEKFMDSLDELDGKVLGCWCSPEPCHGDVILELIQIRKRQKAFNVLFNDGE